MAKRKRRITRKDVSKYHEYLKSPEWYSFRRMVISVNGSKCARCGTDKKLQVHHKTYKNIFKELLSDVEVLCEACHSKHHKKVKAKLRNPRTGKKHRKRSKRLSHPKHEAQTATYYPSRKRNPRTNP